jgi:hypothetical protein
LVSNTRDISRTILATETTASIGTSQTSAWKTTGLSLDAIMEYLTGNAPSYKYELIEKHINALLYDSSYYQEYGVGFSFLAVVLCCVLVLYLMIYLFKTDRVKTRQRIVFTIMSSAAVAGIYHIVYTFTLTEAEAMRLGSEGRYLGSFFLGIIILIICIILNDVNCNKGAEKKIVIVVCMSLIFMTAGGKNFRNGINGKCCSIYAEKTIAAGIREYVPENSKILYFSSDTNGTDYVLQTCFLTPCRVKQLSQYELQSAVPGETYVYLYNTDDEFIEEYRGFFDDTKNINGGCLYKVVNTNQGVRLVEYKKII